MMNQGSKRQKLALRCFWSNDAGNRVNMPSRSCLLVFIPSHVLNMFVSRCGRLASEWKVGNFFYQIHLSEARDNHQWQVNQALLPFHAPPIYFNNSLSYEYLICKWKHIVEQIYFIVTIVMVGIFGVVDTDSSLVNVDSLNLTSVYDDIWATSVDGYGQQANDSNAVAGAADAADAPDMDTSQIHMSQALHVLNVCVLLLSSLGLFSTFLLITGLIQVIDLPMSCSPGGEEGGERGSSQGRSKGGGRRGWMANFR